jgi:hypothetical protein
MNESDSQMYLRHYINKNQNNWVQLLLTVQFVYNNTQNKNMKKHHFEWIMNTT